MSKPTPPDTLADAGKSLWSDVVSKWVLRPDELRVLASACGAADMESEFRRAWVELGRPYMSKGSMGQEVEHPLIGSIDKQAKSKAAFLRQLGLPDAAGPAVNAQRTGGQTRWTNAHGATA